MRNLRYITEAKDVIAYEAEDDGRTVILEPWLDGWAQAVAAGPAEYVAPPPQPAPVPASLSFAQLLIGLVSEQWITVAEGRAWRDRVALPAQLQALIGTLPEDQQFAVETRAFAPSEVLRSDPLVTAMGAAAGKTEEEMDNFFRTYANV